ncbi:MULTISPECIES: LysR family transcriptional regulator [unclassified Variovorax]|uniref:LysR family transcriptional regulator n=1 Tax=unclassified Variovorax TaxID=663243 RepID=UPI003ECE9942
MDRFAAIETFAAVVETGSFSGAARRLNVGQPAVSKSIAQLEERLGVQLLLRSSRSLTPTEAGQTYYGYARRAIDEAEEADLAARGASASLTGRIRVSAAVTFARLHIVPRLGDFLNLHPALSVDVVLDDRNVDLMEEGIDVALRMGDLPDSGMTARKIAQAPRCVVGTPAYFAAHGQPKAPGDLAQHEAVIYTQRGGGASWRFAKDGAEVSVVVTGRVQVTAAEGVRAAVLADLGIAIASEWMFAPELANGTVRRVLTDWDLPVIDLWAVYPSGRKSSAKARAFVDFVQTVLSEASQAIR